MSMRRLGGFAVVVGLAAAGCGSDNLAPSDFCDQMVSALCERAYACVAGLSGSEPECVTAAESKAGCAQWTVASACPGGTYHADQASLCVEQASGLACSHVSVQNIDLSAAPACGKICS
jgi:hypothetical protein